LDLLKLAGHRLDRRSPGGKLDFFLMAGKQN
jgi:hypothetical protein